jgi:hypothetical protein
VLLAPVRLLTDQNQNSIMGMGFLENIEHTWDEGFSFPTINPNPDLGVVNVATNNRVLEHLEEIKRRSSNRYLITTLRDNEEYVRSALFFDNPIDAVEGYNRYQDHGFAKESLTVTLYDPFGTIHKKVLRRNIAGDATFVRKNYYDTTNLLKSIRPKVSPEVYEELVSGFANIFNEDNWRFNPDRFLEDLK